jgi:transcriptional regulator with GAF, ATPase, and Fis domain
MDSTDTPHPHCAEVESGESGAMISLASMLSGAEIFAGMLVNSPELSKLMESVRRVAPFRVPVLIQGESGTGKELMARAMHLHGPASDGPFVSLNCSNLVESLADAQLFGHVRGAYTDAREESLGYFRSADGGTLFLDEIGEMPPAVQPKLLRVLESGELQPVGSPRTFKTNVRLVAATNRDLAAMVKQGRFRADLYYRLAAARIAIPPLRARRENLGALVAYLIERLNELHGRRIKSISSQALRLMEAYEWPGNVRELYNALHTAMLLADGDYLCANHFDDLQKRAAGEVSAGEDGFTKSGGVLQIEDGRSFPGEPNAASAAERSDAGGYGKIRTLRQATEEAMKQAILSAMRAAGGNAVRAAVTLGVSRYTVYRLAKRYGLNKKLNSVIKSR